MPADLAASYVALKNLLGVEAPMGDLEVEAGRETAAELAVQDRYLSEAGRTRVASYALDAGGEVVAYSVAAVSNEHHDHVDQWGTLVDPAHRGHRLGMAVKCAQLRALSEGFSDKDFVETTNAETNAHMVAINEALGFEVAQVYGDFQKRLLTGRLALRVGQPERPPDGGPHRLRALAGRQRLGDGPPVELADHVLLGPGAGVRRSERGVHPAPELRVSHRRVARTSSQRSPWGLSPCPTCSTDHPAPSSTARSASSRQYVKWRGDDTFPWTDHDSPSPSFSEAWSRPPGRVASARRPSDGGQVVAVDVQQARAGPDRVVRRTGRGRVGQVVVEGVEHVGVVAVGPQHLDEGGRDVRTPDP